MEAAIVEDFFKKGKLLRPEALTLVKDGYEYKYTKDLVVGKEHFEKIQINNMVEFGEFVTTSDIVAQINKKYEKMRAIISSRLQKNFLSINNLQKGEVFLIGVVKEIDGYRIEVEDPTGVINVNAENHTAELDDVIAIKGIFDGTSVTNGIMMLPDVPIRPPKKSQGKICITTGLDFKEAPESYIEKFFNWFAQSDAKTLIAIGKADESMGKIYERACKDKKMIFVRHEYPNKGNNLPNSNIISASNPCMININGIKILVVTDFSLENLRKRQFKQPKTPCEPLVVEDVPDVIVYNNQNEPQVNNYKSTTFVSTGSILSNFKPVVMDLGTRETTQKHIDF